MTVATNTMSAAGCEPFVKGHPSNPFMLGDCVERFVTAAGAAARPLATKRLERFVAMVEDLEHVKDAGEMAPLLA
ncbi:MAG: hypothetical protein ACREM3_23295 [Candidatus Rokuibacteriota bacterium]